MENRLKEIARKFFNSEYENLTEREQKIIQHITTRTHISRNVNKEYEEKLSAGEKIADRVAAFGGSWTFIIIFLAVLFSWIILNSFILLYSRKVFDPYPYILLNLVLSMIAAIQAPVILMSQNRQATRDRMDASHDYEVNLKAEIEILSLHEKIDEMREKQLSDLIQLQNDQLNMLKQLLSKKDIG